MSVPGDSEPIAEPRQRVVLVGNGPTLRAGTRGAEIDGFDLVVRFNNFVVDGFAEQVGRRTDVWCCCFYQVEWRRPAAWGFREVLLPRNAPGAWPESWQRLVEARGEVRIARTSEHTIAWMHRRGLGRASAGAIALAYYLETYPRVWIAGYDHFAQSAAGAAGHHYWAGDTRPRACPHHGAREAEWVDGLVARGRVVRLGGGA